MFCVRIGLNNFDNSKDGIRNNLIYKNKAFLFSLTCYGAR